MSRTILADPGLGRAGLNARLGHPFRGGEFAAGILAVSLLLQRFAIPAGGQGIDVVGPIGLFLAGMALLRGDFVVDQRRFTIFVSLLCWLFFSSFLREIYPNSFNIPFSISSFGQFVLLNVFCVLSFSNYVDEYTFFRRVTQMLAVIAIAGIIQFIVQIVGIGVFSFSGLVPEKLLFESGYNLVIATGIGALNKSNGFFLLEPSIFSQVMAIGLIIEMLAFRRLFYLVLFSAALVLAFSGTGLMVLAAFLISASFRLGSRGILVGFAGLAIIGLVAAAAIYILPDVANVFLHRINEIDQPGSSGYARFRTPFQALASVWNRENGAWLIGIGAGATRHINLPFSYDANTPIKISLEFGLPALVLYTVMILRVERTRIQDALIPPSIVLLFFAGGYEEFAPILFPIFLLLCIPKLRPAPQNSAGLIIASPLP